MSKILHAGAAAGALPFIVAHAVGRIWRRFVRRWPGLKEKVTSASGRESAFKTRPDEHYVARSRPAGFKDGVTEWLRGRVVARRRLYAGVVLAGACNAV